MLVDENYSRGRMPKVYIYNTFILQTSGSNRGLMCIYYQYPGGRGGALVPLYRVGWPQSNGHSFVVREKLQCMSSSVTRSKRHGVF